MMGRNVLILFLCSVALISAGSGASGILLNGTGFYLTTGESQELYQGYALSLKSVSSDGSVWLQLTERDKVVKSDIVYSSGYFMYNRTNTTILSVLVNKVYSGSPEQNLVSISIYQFIDPDLPAPVITTIIPVNTMHQNNNNPLPKVQAFTEPLIWVLGICFIIILFYVLRKFW
jgi:hypothetical protein